MNECYFCGKTFNNDDVKKHGEHIIQQAIGGNLIANDILCETCGNDLGKSIDVPFTNIFSSIARRLDIKTDRGNSNLSVEGTYKKQRDQFGNEIDATEVFWNNFKVSPKKPFNKYKESSNEIIIYANTKTAKKYKAMVEKEISEKFKDKKPEIILCDDLKGWVEYKFNMDNESFKRGLAKIAISFALKNGINRNELSMVLSIDKETKKAKINDKLALNQFIPLGVIDKLIEKEKEQFTFTPHHFLALFSVGKYLFCYIELFSTFQWYITLSDNYSGLNIYKYHAQEIMKQEDFSFNPGRDYHKERDSLMAYFNITEDRITKKLAKSKEERSRNDIEIEILKEEHEKRKYEFDYPLYLYKILHIIGGDFIKLINKKHFKDDINNTLNFKKNYCLFYDQNDDDSILMSNYRKCFFEGDIPKIYVSELCKMHEELRNSEIYKDYGFIKMRALESYIQRENAKKK